MKQIDEIIKKNDVAKLYKQVKKECYNEKDKEFSDKKIKNILKELQTTSDYYDDEVKNKINNINQIDQQ
jgi:hypothetical protein